jgi:hypothetical protein
MTKRWMISTAVVLAGAMALGGCYYGSDGLGGEDDTPTAAAPRSAPGSTGSDVTVGTADQFAGDLGTVTNFAVPWRRAAGDAVEHVRERPHRRGEYPRPVVGDDRAHHHRRAQPPEPSARHPAPLHQRPRARREQRPAGERAGVGCARGPAVMTDQALPLRRVVVYRNGVGYFERQGRVAGDSVRFRVLQSRGGGLPRDARGDGAGRQLSVRAAAFPMPEEPRRRRARPAARRAPHGEPRARRPRARPRRGLHRRDAHLAPSLPARLRRRRQRPGAGLGHRAEPLGRRLARRAALPRRGRAGVVSQRARAGGDPAAPGGDRPRRGHRRGAVGETTLAPKRPRRPRRDPGAPMSRATNARHVAGWIRRWRRRRSSGVRVPRPRADRRPPAPGARPTTASPRWMATPPSGVRRPASAAHVAGAAQPRVARGARGAGRGDPLRPAAAGDGARPQRHHGDARGARDPRLADVPLRARPRRGRLHRAPLPRRALREPHRRPAGARPHRHLRAGRLPRPGHA